MILSLFISIFFGRKNLKKFLNQIRTTWAEERTVKIIEKIGWFYLKLFMEILYKSLWWVDKEILFLYEVGRIFQFLICHNLPHFYRLIYRGSPCRPQLFTHKLYLAILMHFIQGIGSDEILTTVENRCSCSWNWTEHVRHCIKSSMLQNMLDNVQLYNSRFDSV